MKFILALLFVSLIASGLGYGLTSLEFQGVREEFMLGATLSDTPAAQGVDQVTSDAPKAVFLEGTDFDFGTKEQHTTIPHVFKVRNDGKGSLVIDDVKPSCGACVHPKFEKVVIGPGETADLLVEYVTRKPGPEFRETLEVATNDPLSSRVTLIARGIILSTYQLDPSELTFGSIPISEGAVGKFVAAHYHEEKVVAKDPIYSNPATSEFFTVDFASLPEDQIKRFKYAKSAVEATVKLKPGLPLGPLSQTIQFKFGAAENPVDVAVRGTVVSDITISKGGGDFRFENDILAFGTISRVDGMKADLFVMVKGPDREKIELKVAKADPENAISATLGEKRSQGGGAVIVYPFKVEIVKNGPQVNLAGPPGNKQGVIEIETTHPEAKLLRVFVRFATRD